MNMATARLFPVPVLGISWWLLGHPPGWDWVFWPVIPTMGVSLGLLITFATVVVGLFGGLLWLRDNLSIGS
jgi:hypothetical protein